MKAVNQFKDSDTFQVLLTEDFDIRDLNPFKVQVSVRCNDVNFKERIVNLIKERHIDIVIDSSYNHPIQIAVRKLFNLGFMDISVKEYCGDKTLLDQCFEPGNRCYSFESEEKQLEATLKIRKVLNLFLNKEYQKYESLRKYQAQ